MIAPNNKINRFIMTVKDHVSNSVKGIEEIEEYYKNYPEKLTHNAASELDILLRLKRNLMEINDEIRLHR